MLSVMSYAVLQARKQQAPAAQKDSARQTAAPLQSLRHLRLSLPEATEHTAYVDRRSDRARISEDHLLHLSKLRSLVTLDLSGRSVDLAALSAFSAALTRLTSIHLDDSLQGDCSSTARCEATGCAATPGAGCDSLLGSSIARDQDALRSAGLHRIELTPARWSTLAHAHTCA